MKIRLDKKALMPLILFASLFINEDVLVFGTINDSKMVSFRLGVQVCLAVFLVVFMMINHIGISRRKIKIFSVFTFFYLVTMFVNRDLRPGYFFMLLIYFICLALVTIYSFDEIYSFFSNFMFVICVASLIGYFIQLVIPSVLKFFPVIQNSPGTNFYFLGLTNLSFRTDVLVRNWGPFREPGVFQLFIIVALIYTLFKESKSSWIKPLIFIVTIITTFSTTGYIALSFIMLSAVMINKNKITKGKRRFLLFIIIAFILIMLYLTFFTNLIFKSDGYGSVFGKIFGSYKSLSYNARMASIWANLKIFMGNPIFGRGLTFVDQNYQIIASDMYGMRIVDNTNMLFIILARFGVGAFLYFLIRLYKSIKYSMALNIIPTILIFISYLSLMTGENLSYSVILILPIFFLSSDFNKKKDVKSNE